MRCHEFKSRLHEVLDRRDDPEHDRVLREHARHCAGCRQTFLAQRRLFDLLHCRAVPVPDSDRLERLVSALEAEVQRLHGVAQVRPTGWTGRLARGWAVVAASLLLVGLATWFTRPPRPVDVGAMAKQPANRSSPQRVVSRSPHRHLPAVALPRRPGHPVSPPPANPTDSAHEELRLAWHPAELLLEAPRLPARWQTYRPTVDELVVAIPQVAQRLDEVDAWAPGLRPLRLSLVRVWEALFPTAAWWHQNASEPKPQTGDATIADERRWV